MRVPGRSGRSVSRIAIGTPRVAARRDRARVQHLGAGGGDFLRFGVVQAREQARVGHFARVRAEHAGDVGPDLDALRAEQRAEVRGRRIGAAAAEDRGAAVGVAGDEALRHQHAARAARRSARCRPRRPASQRQLTDSRCAHGARVRQRHAHRASRAHRTSRSRGPACAGRPRRASRTAVRPAPALRPARPVRAAVARASVASARKASRRSPSTASAIEVEFAAERAVALDQRVDARVDVARRPPSTRSPAARW